MLPIETHAEFSTFHYFDKNQQPDPLPKAVITTLTSTSINCLNNDAKYQLIPDGVMENNSVHCFIIQIRGKILYILKINKTIRSYKHMIIEVKILLCRYSKEYDTFRVQLIRKDFSQPAVLSYSISSEIRKLLPIQKDFKNIRHYSKICD